MPPNSSTRWPGLTPIFLRSAVRLILMLHCQWPEAPPKSAVPSSGSPVRGLPDRIRRTANPWDGCTSGCGKPVGPVDLGTVEPTPKGADTFSGTTFRAVEHRFAVRLSTLVWTCWLALSAEHTGVPADGSRAS